MPRSRGKNTKDDERLTFRNCRLDYEKLRSVQRCKVLSTYVSHQRSAKILMSSDSFNTWLIF